METTFESLPSKDLLSDYDYSLDFATKYKLVCGRSGRYTAKCDLKGVGKYAATHPQYILLTPEPNF